MRGRQVATHAMGYSGRALGIGQGFFPYGGGGQVWGHVINHTVHQGLTDLLLPLYPLREVSFS